MVGLMVFSVSFSIGCVELPKIRQGLPADPWAPTLNEYNGLGVWEKKALREATDGKIWIASKSWVGRNAVGGGWDMGIVRLPGKRGRAGRVIEEGQARKRIVLVARFSHRCPDEVSADVIGGKIPIDRLVRFGVLRDDSPKWCERKAEWQPILKDPEKAQRVVVSVYETPGWVER